MSIGRRQSHAKKLFQTIIQENDMESLYVRGTQKSVKISRIGARKGWLGPWMQKCDENAIILTGKRVWNSGYINNSRSAKKNVPVDLSSLPSDQWDESYRHYPVLSSDDAPSSLIYLICQHSLLSNLEINGQEAEFKNQNNVFIGNNKLEEGQAIPLLREDFIYSLQLSSFIAGANKKMALELAKKKIREQEPSQPEISF